MTTKHMNNNTKMTKGKEDKEQNENEVREESPVDNNEDQKNQNATVLMG